MKKILIIEDDQFIREIISMSLKLNNYKTIEAENGEIGFMKAKQYMPDLIISDIMMPIMDGYDTLIKIRDDKKMANIPFIFLTALNTSASKRLGMELGANDYLTKPFNLSELLSSIKLHLNKDNKGHNFFTDMSAYYKESR